MLYYTKFLPFGYIEINNLLIGEIECKYLTTMILFLNSAISFFIQLFIFK